MEYVYFIVLKTGNMYLPGEKAYSSLVVAEADRKRYVWPEAFRMVELPVVCQSQYSPLPTKGALNATSR